MMDGRSLKGSWLLVVLAGWGAAGGCTSGSSTQVDVTITVDSGLLPTAVNKIKGTIAAPNRNTVTVDLPAETAQHWLITPQNVTQSFNATITVVGESSADGGATTDVVTAIAYVKIQPGLHLSVPIELSPLCEGLICPADQTCRAGSCVPIPQFGADGGASDAPSGAGGGTGGATGGGGHAGSTGAAGQGGMGGKPKLNPGQACTATSDCASGVCSSVDHVCCDSDCAGTCQSCVGAKTGKTDGACNPLPAGSNADNDCSVGTTPCGTTGSCDGNGKCALTPAATSCPGTSACSGNQLTVTPAACDGKGACVPGSSTTSACPGGVNCMSNGTACLPTSCTADGNCTAGSYCDLGTHTCTAKRDLGGSCTGTNQCTSGYCADGVCCNNGCLGTCEACIQTKTNVASGHCAAVSAGTDPDNECAPDGTTCGRTGLCNQNGGSGGGGCAYTTSGTGCAGTFSCSGNGTTSTTTGSCDGAGTCKQSAASGGTCGGYTCASVTACGTSCSASAGCIPGYVCIGGSCVASAFRNGPCVVAPDYFTATVFALGNDGRIHQKSAPSGTWGSWVTLSVDASVLDTRSDLDCAANSSVTHITATGSSPLGAFMHATGSGTTFNAFTRELSGQIFSVPGASVWQYPSGNNYIIGAMDANPIVYDVYNGTYTEIDPITNRVNLWASSTIDVAQQAGGGGAARIVAGFDDTGLLGIYTNYISTAPMYWYSPPVLLSPPSGTTFQYSPTICVDTGYMGGYQFHAAAVAGNGQVWHTWVNTLNSDTFPGWEKIGTGAAASVDCTMLGDESVHVVTLNGAGHVLDIHGTPGSWTTTDLGSF